MLIIGSQALLAWGVKIGRKPSDIDVIATQLEVADFVLREKDRIQRSETKPNKVILHMKNREIIEFEVASPENQTALDILTIYPTLGYPKPGATSPLGEPVHPDVVLTFKLSHRYLKNSPHFKKTMDDILALRGLKYRVPPGLKDWLKARSKATYHYAHPSLNRDKKAFFSGDGVDYKYEHDDIHAALATLAPSFINNSGLFTTEDGFHWNFVPVPAYSFFQADGAEVKTSKEKFFACSEEIKLKSVLEESYVLALERSQIPNDFNIAPRTSFLMALEKVCTSITSGWWREYAWENYHKVLGMYSDDYVDTFQKALAEGKIRDYMGEAA